MHLVELGPLDSGGAQSEGHPCLREPGNGHPGPALVAGRCNFLELSHEEAHGAAGAEAVPRVAYTTAYLNHRLAEAQQPRALLEEVIAPVELASTTRASEQQTSARKSKV